MSPARLSEYIIYGSERNPVREPVREGVERDVRPHQKGAHVHVRRPAVHRLRTFCLH
jgi:hypothetical protein